MDPQESHSSSRLLVWRRLAATAFAITHNRLDLAALEFQEEKWRVGQVLFWGATFFFLALLAAVLVTLSVIVLFWKPAGEFLLAGFAVLYCLLASWAFRSLRQQLKNWPPPFSGTISEIKKDGECLSPPK